VPVYTHPELLSIRIVYVSDAKLLNVALVPTVMVLTVFPDESIIVYVNVPVGEPVFTNIFIVPLLPQFEFVDVIEETANPFGVIKDTDCVSLHRPESLTVTTNVPEGKLVNV